RFEFTGQVAADLDAENYSVGDARLSLSAQGERLPFSPLDTRLEWAAVEADMKQQLATVREFAITAFGVNVAANVEATKVTDAPRARGAVNITAGDLSQTAQQLQGLLPEGMSLGGQARGKVQFEYDQQQGTARVPEFAFSALGVDVGGEMNVQGTNSERPKFSGRINVRELDRKSTRLNSSHVKISY